MLRMPSSPPLISRRRGTLLAAGAIFAAGVVAGISVGPRMMPLATAAPAFAAAGSGPAHHEFPSPQRHNPAFAYPADVLRVIDGDTFEARVRVWPGLDVDTKVRLRGIDAAELHARCAGELAQARAARAALQAILAEGDVTVSRVGIDKYGGRVDAVAATRHTPDVSAAMLDGGFARRYAGGRRGSWCE